MPEAFDEYFITLILATGIYRPLAQWKVVEIYAISSDRSRGWVTINGDNAAVVQGVVEQFPLYRYLCGVEIEAFFVFDNAASSFPHISLD